MKLSFGLAALAGLASAWPSYKLSTRAESAITYVDPDTGFTFSEFKAAYTLQSNIVYRMAVPSNPPSGAYDIVIQVVTPNQVGWNGLAWGGNMVRNPLTVAYPNGNKVTLSSRWATGHTTPSMYTGATYTLLTNGNKVNGSHWQFTAKCSGCTTWTGASGAQRINPAATSQRLAFAWSPTKPGSPGSNTSTIAVHDTPNYWYHDFTKGVNPNFDELLARNGGK
ncbi:iron reductase domain protein [Lentithecium fluviatile CBS 122367]|uniref:Iron reductase domain protein n=1 Tax=Lentithecium fluviatile CBS 122367 TaxID=1168545 RepID=A0A6G1JN52_9PLEO|nr:iron reductase domain protein [Lentithecium fluviatile CBS 122367]